MKLSNKLWIALVFGFLAIILGFNIPSRIKGQQEERRDDKSSDERSLTKLLAQFPVAIYDASPALSESERASRTAKSRRYDGRSAMVMQDEPHSDGSVVLFDGVPSRRKLPIDESKLVVVAEVVDAKAFLSNDKLNVYSEFRFRVDEVIKDESTKVKAGAFVVADRIGGYVLYPNGKKMLYHLSGLLMPRIQKRYLLFLASNGETDNYEIVSGFELEGFKIFPLNREDVLPQLEKLNENSLKDAVRREIGSVRKP